MASGYRGSICLFKSTDAFDNNILIEEPYFLGTYNPVEEKFNPRRIEVQDIVKKPKVTEDPTSSTEKEVRSMRLGFDHWSSSNR